MKVKLLCSRSGVGFSQNMGDEIEVGDGEGLRMIDAGQCVPVDLAQDEAARLAAEEGQAPAAVEEGEAAPAAVDVEEAKNKTETETATKKVSTEKAVKK